MIEILTNLTIPAQIIIVTILTIMTVSFLSTLAIRSKYRRIGNDLKNELNIEREAFSFEVLNSSLKDYKTAAQSNPNEVNTQAIIEKNFHENHKGLSLGERFVKSSVSIMIILGLLGTFYGLTLSIGDLVEFLSESASAEVLNSIDDLVQKLISSVQGMSVAFVTSLFGISASIVITIIGILISIEDARESVMVKIEEYLDNSIALKFARGGAGSDYGYSSEIDIVDKFSEKIEEKLRDVFENLGNQLIAVTTYNQNSAEGLQKSIETFDKSLQTFSENTRDFAEFNYNLRTNIERMDVSFADLVQDLKSSTKDFSKSHQTVKELSDNIDKLANKL